ncbi:uncharacterized protein K441DRAFT_577843 [Cenococcum geophilum 1.58]|uniref:uncharacterized protein n=1 Tax=Cenococcum geophilum 1.58 TaxID=794803 RepID=UPI00358F9C28|nr:hypothetical protein K441DRAFT_577843 [Cenococcum geophilum 1.58]
MAPLMPMLSSGLRGTTELKIDELERMRRSYEQRKAELLAEAEGAGSAAKDQRARVSTLLSGVKKLDPSSENDDDLTNMSRWLDQAGYDRSISTAKLGSFEKTLRLKLEYQSRRLELADLHAQLLEEWIRQTVSSRNSLSTKLDKVILDQEDEFEVVEEGQIPQLREKFESIAFTPLETDAEEIDRHLLSFFPGENGTRALEELRENMKEYGDDSLGGMKIFTDETLQYSIKDLLQNELLSDEKRTILQDYQQSPVVLREIASTLNMKFSDIRNWKWRSPEKGLRVEARQNSDGIFCMTAEEDLLETLFLQGIGVSWSIVVKGCLKGFIKKEDRVWKRTERPSLDELDKRDYYLSNRRKPRPANMRQLDFLRDFFLSRLPERPSGLYGRKCWNENTSPTIQSAKETQAMLIRQLATEMQIRQALDGEVAIVKSDFESFATSLPHSTILSVLKFIGVPEDWLVFFKKFLECPLNMGPVIRGTADQVRIRKRGVPVGHGFEKLFGETVLFFMDLAVHQEAGMLLYRLRDEAWLCGKPEKCTKAWNAMCALSMVFGLNFNRNKTGSVSLGNTNAESNETVSIPHGELTLGFLNLEKNYGKWVIDQSKVDTHIRHLRKQLSSCTSILSWIHAWNTSAGHFAGHLFGEPANCLGKEHLDSLFAVYEKIERSIFGDSNGIASSLTDHIKHLLVTRFGATSVPDAFIFMPEQFGGLGVLNPFTTLSLSHNVFEKPEKVMQDFLKEERAAYDKAKERFEILGQQGRLRKLEVIYPDKDKIASIFTDGDTDTFMSFEEYTRWRESAANTVCLYEAYKDLYRVPEDDVETSREVNSELRRLHRTQGGFCYWQLSSEERWVVQLYSEELFERYGGLSLVDKNWLPLRALKMLRGEEDDDEDDDVSVYSEV